MNNGMLVCLVAGFVPMSSQSKEEAVRVAVGSSRCYRHGTAAWEGILSSNRQRPTDASGRRSVPKVQTHHTYHMQMRDLFLVLHQ